MRIFIVFRTMAGFFHIINFKIPDPNIYILILNKFEALIFQFTKQFGIWKIGIRLEFRI